MHTYRRTYVRTIV